MEVGVGGSDEVGPIKKKRKQKSTDVIDDIQGPSKIARGESVEDFPWKSLQLILTLQDKNTDLTKKLELAFDYVRSRSMKVPDDISCSSHVIDTSRTVAFLSNWVQSVLIYSEKKTRVEKNKPDFGTPGSFLDIRCWQSLHFCLEESRRLHTSLTCSKDFLRVIHSIEMDVLSCLSDQSCREGKISGEKLQFYDAVLDCLSLIFSTHGGVANENLELWILLIDKTLELILKVVSGQIEGNMLVNFVLRLSCYLFEPFARFLRVHPLRKNGFHSFIDKLLQPLLHLVHVLHFGSHGSQDEWNSNLSKFVEEVLAQGLFHSTHIDGFLSLQSSNRYRNSCDSIVEEEKLVNKSYHRHLFDKVEKIVAQKNESALTGLGELLRLFASSVANNKAASVSGVSMNLDVNSIFHNPTNRPLSRTASSETMDAGLRKSIFDFFVQIMEYLLTDLDKCLQLNGEVPSILSDVSITLRSINNLLANFIREKLYIRTEDISDGASRNFLRFSYTRVTPVSAKIAHQKTSCFGSDNKPDRDLLISVRKELIITIRHLLDIEYEVVGDDLESLWILSFSSLPCCHGSMDVPDHSLLFAEILSLGCRLIDLYSDLRQVDTCIFALCQAARHSLSFAGHGEECNSSSTCSSYANSLSMLFGSLQFRRSLSNAVKVIPEGQLAKCIRHLSSDIKDSLTWIKLGHHLDDLGENVKSNPHCFKSLQFHLQAEILGKVLSDAYTIILESVTVTGGNSSLVGDSLKELIEIIRPILSSLVFLQPDGRNEFFIVIDGRTLSKNTVCDNLSMCWILKFLFHLLLSCRSLFRKAISLMASDTSKETSDFIGDPFLAQSTKGSVEMTDSADEGFFSWILEPSASLLHVINSVSEICIQDSVVFCSPLLYVLTSMAIQRLVDLNKLIEISYYALSWNGTMRQNKRKDDNDVSPYSKKSISKMKKEAAGLTKFIMGNILSLDEARGSTPSFGSGLDVIVIQGQHHNGDSIDFAMGSLDEKSLLSALWYQSCKNVDVWCSHAIKKDLKSFLSLVIRTSLSYINGSDGHLKTHRMAKPGHEKNVNFHQIALEFLMNSTEYNNAFIWRYMAPRFCRILRKSVSSLFATSGEDLGTSPDWVEVISTVEKLSDMLPWTKTKMAPAEFCNTQDVGFATCQSTLALLTWMPEKYLGSKSSLYITHVLNLERLLVDSLLGWRGTSSSHDTYQILEFFITCRRVLRILAVASSKEKVNRSQSPHSCKFADSSFPLLWLLKSLSVVIEFQQAIPENIGLEAKGMIISLLDHTSDLLLTVSRDLFECAVTSFIHHMKLHEERKGLDPGNGESEQSEYCLQVNPEENLDALDSVFELCKALEERIQKSLPIIEDACLGKKVEFMATFQDLNKLSTAIACFHGVLQGLASTLGDINSLDNNFRIKFSSYNVELIARINSCVDAFMSSTAFVLKLLFLEDGATVNMSAFGDTRREAAIPDPEVFLTKVQHQGCYLKKSLLLKILGGENAEAAILLQQLFMSFSAILRLNLQINLTSSLWSILPVAIGISQFLLLESSKNEVLHQFAIRCLDGVVKFLEELGNYLPQFDPSLSRDFYAQLIGLHLRVIGKCISMQGKGAKLASQETGSQAKKLNNRVPSFSSLESIQLSVLKKRLRMSFITYIKKSSKLHLLSAIQAVERALVGVQEGLLANYEIVFGSSTGGEVSSVVAGGIDCLDLILEYVTGTKCLNMIKRHIPSLVGCLYNIILHLQGSRIFFRCVDSVEDHKQPDSGLIIHMCIEVLAKISGKSSLFRIDACHVAESLRVPGALFQYFLQLQIPKTPVYTMANLCSSNSFVDSKFSVELYASCCRMLCSALKNHKSETRHCIAILEDSVAVLLHCLENASGTKLFMWKVEEAVVCANGLRRVYEMVRPQKDVLGRFAFLLLSRYISVYCGFGPARNGIISEADNALRPGLYALLDCCSADDLQLLHTQLGEGSCRSLLAELQHEYKIKFRFQGKI